MTIDPTLYRSIGNLTGWVVRFSIATIIVSTLEIAVNSYQALFVVFNPQIDNVYVIIGIFVLILSILLTITLLFWYYRSNKNIHSFGAKEVSSPRMAVIWWFVPIAFLWKPYHVTQQIWRASNPEIKLANGTEWKNVPSSKIIKLWWFLYLASIVGSIVAGIGSGIGFVALYNADSELLGGSTQATLLQTVVSIPFLILNIISTYYFIRVVTQVSKWQYQKSLS